MLHTMRDLRTQLDNRRDLASCSIGDLSKPFPSPSPLLSLACIAPWPHLPLPPYLLMPPSRQIEFVDFLCEPHTNCKPTGGDVYFAVKVHLRVYPNGGYGELVVAFVKYQIIII